MFEGVEVSGVVCSSVLGSVGGVLGRSRLSQWCHVTLCVLGRARARARGLSTHDRDSRPLVLVLQVQNLFFED